MSRRLALVAVAAIVAVLTIAGTALWIAGVARRAPAVTPAIMRSMTAAGGTVSIDAEAGTRGPIAATAATLSSYARALATGQAQARLVDLRVRRGGRPFMRLVFDGGVLAGGAVAGGAPEHLLDLAGEGSRWPDAGDPAVTGYCGRIETASSRFCTKARGSQEGSVARNEQFVD